MSSMTQRYQMIAESTFVDTNLDSHTTRGASVPEFQKNRSLLRVSYRLWFSLLADFCLQANLSEEQTATQLKRLQGVVESTTYIELSEACSDIYDFARRLRTASECKYSAFKAQNFHKGLLHILRVFIELQRLREDPCWLRCIMTFCVFPFRTRVVDSELSEKMLNDYISIESDIAQNDAVGYPELLVKGVNKILRDWLKGWNDPVVPNVTSGSVSDPRLRTKADKYRALERDSLIDYMLRKEQGTSTQYYSPLTCDLQCNRTEKVIFVPKNATKLRTVCCQPNTLQYYQSGIQMSIYRYINSDRWLSQHIPLRNQESPRKLAAQGSKYSTLATLDLSAASDRISWLLVRRLFAGTRYLRWMYATRANYSTLPNGETIVSQKAFAMGACLCFPTMSLMLAAVVRFVEQRAPRNMRGARPWTVYGDDIICPCDWAPAVMQCLEHLGLVVNRSKSFYGFDDSYRESCGMEAWNGWNVTPLRFPRTFSPSKRKAELVSCFVQLANSFFLEGCKVARLTIFKLMREYCDCGPYSAPGKQICFSDELFSYNQHFSADVLFQLEKAELVLDPRGFLLTNTSTNFKAPKRWRLKGLQKWEYRCLHLSISNKGRIWSQEDEDLRLFDCLLRMLRRSMHEGDIRIDFASEVDEYSFSSQLVPLLRRGWLCP